MTDWSSGFSIARVQGSSAEAGDCGSVHGMVGPGCGTKNHKGNK